MQANANHYVGDLPCSDHHRQSFSRQSSLRSSHPYAPWVASSSAVAAILQKLDILASAMGSLFITALSFGAQALPAPVSPALIDRSLGASSSEISMSAYSQSSVQMQSFVSSWQSLSQQFTQTESVFQQQASVTVAYQSVQTLIQTYQSTLSQYQACSACATGLDQSGFQTEFRQTVTRMYTSFQTIIATGQQLYSSQWSSQFACTFSKSNFYSRTAFQGMSSFGNFCQNVSGNLNIDLGGLLGGLGLNLDLFLQIGIDLGGILGGASGGLLGGLLGGGQGGGLLGGLL
ncbi:uncharacterized protein VP01_3g4 [Puccinia sorghi]|uniref:Uncharacterized protein n=1 Tax=Puccinia sorghi TaxID=27349 RepID=A0A0L6URZ1_9BASI|nr:uncharacterized protein VP01_3g4 [Puccinia sorghi]